MLTNCLAGCTHLSSTVSQLFEPQVQKNRHFTYPGLRFLFALGTPLWQSRKTLHKCKDNSVLAELLAAYTHLSSTLSQLFEPQVQKSSFSRTAAHIFVSPGDAPWAITLNVVWMEREFDAYKLSRSIYPSIFNSFPVIRIAKQKIAVFTYHSPHFCFSWRRPCDYHAKCSTDGKTIQCLPNPSPKYLSILNTFRVIRCLSQCVSPKIAIFTTFWFPLETPLGQLR